MRRDIAKVKAADTPDQRQVDDDEAQWIADDCAREARLGNYRGFTDVFDALNANQSQQHAPQDPDDPDGDELTGEALERTRATANAIAGGIVSALRERGARAWRVKHVVRDRWVLAVRFRDLRIRSVEIEDLRHINEDPEGRLGRNVVDASCKFLLGRAA